MADSSWHIAQFNVARALAPTDSPLLAPFMAQLDTINELAERSPGFVWRLKGDSGNATDIQVGDDPLFLVNFSVWTSVEALFEFVYRSAHQAVMANRREWFERPSEAHFVLWWIPEGHVPTTSEGLARLEQLRKLGPTPSAFAIKRRFPPPEHGGAGANGLP